MKDFSQLSKVKKQMVQERRDSYRRPGSNKTSQAQAQQAKPDDADLFRQAMGDISQIKQDTVTLKPAKKVKRERQETLARHGADLEMEYFSDQFQPLLPEEGPTRYIRTDVSKYELKKLRRGDYPPELELDLHGMDQASAKRELAALIYACRKEHFACASVMHGIGKHVLKRQVPLWLAQHPHVMAFHQAPLEWGGDGALLVLIELDD